MPTSSPPPDKFQREIDDIIRLAEKRLDRQSFGSRARRQVRRMRPTFRGPGWRMPPAEVLAGWALALLLLSWLVGLLGLIGISFARPLAFGMQAVGLALLAAALILSLTRGRIGGGGEKTWRGERVSYGNPYGGGDLLERLRRLFRGRR